MLSLSAGNPNPSIDRFYEVIVNPSDLITFVGPGVMAEAIISGLIRKSVARPEQIRAAGPNPERREDLKTRYGLAPSKYVTVDHC